MRGPHAGARPGPPRFSACPFDACLSLLFSNVTVPAGTARKSATAFTAAKGRGQAEPPSGAAASSRHAVRSCPCKRARSNGVAFHRRYADTPAHRKDITAHEERSADHRCFHRLARRFCCLFRVCERRLARLDWKHGRRQCSSWQRREQRGRNRERRLVRSGRREQRLRRRPELPRRIDGHEQRRRQQLQPMPDRFGMPSFVRRKRSLLLLHRDAGQHGPMLHAHGEHLSGTHEQ